MFFMFLKSHDISNCNYLQPRTSMYTNIRDCKYTKIIIHNFLIVHINISLCEYFVTNSSHQNGILPTAGKVHSDG